MKVFGNVGGPFALATTKMSKLRIVSHKWDRCNIV
jgi:hypothetical protein